MCLTAQADLGCDLLTPARGRHFVTRSLIDAVGPGVLSRMNQGDIELVATELLTNATRIASRKVRLELTMHRRWIQVAVTDDGPGAPVPQVAAPTDEHGRGLAIVATLALEWGVEHHRHEKTVWARLPIDGVAPDALACDVPEWE